MEKIERSSQKKVSNSVRNLLKSEKICRVFDLILLKLNDSIYDTWKSVEIGWEQLDNHVRNMYFFFARAINWRSMLIPNRWRQSDVWLMLERASSFGERPPILVYFVAINRDYPAWTPLSRADLAKLVIDEKHRRRFQ